MRQVTVGVLGNREIVIRNDDVSAACRIVGDLSTASAVHGLVRGFPAGGERHFFDHRGPPRGDVGIGNASFSGTAARASGCARARTTSYHPANIDSGPERPVFQTTSKRVGLATNCWGLLETAADDTEDLQKALDREHHRAELLARELAVVRHLEMLLTLHKAAESVQSKPLSESKHAEQPNSLQRERDRLTQAAESGAAELCDVLPGNRADWSDQAGESNAIELRNSLQQERDRSGRLEQELAAAQRDAEVVRRSGQAKQMRRRTA